MTEQEAIKNIQYAIESIKEDALLDEDFIPSFEMAIDALEKQSMVNEILNEAEQYKLALFNVIRNHIIRDTMADAFGIEVNDVLAVKTMKKIIEQCRFHALKVFYEDALAKMGGK